MISRDALLIPRRISALSLLGSLCFLLSVLAGAAESAFVETVPPANANPWLGQQIVFSIDVGVEGRFSGATYFDLPEVPGAILMKVEERPTLSTRRVGDSEYTVQRHEFMLFTQRAGTITVPQIGVRCGSILSFGEPVQNHSLSAPPIRVTSRGPDGARTGETFVSSSGLKISENWSPAPGKSVVGDAFTRTVTFRAPDVPGMLLPTVKWETSEGLAVYPREPDVQDRMERGEFSGERRESAVYVCEKPGHYEVPELEFRWWNTGEKTWKTVTLPGMVIEVASGGPDAAAGREQAPREGVTGEAGRSAWFRIGAGVVALLLATAIWWGMRRWRRERPEEEQVFRELMQACRDNDPMAAYNAHTRWRATLATAEGIAPGSGIRGGAMEKVWLELQRALVAGDRMWDGRRLEEGLKVERRRTRRRTRRGPRRPLPPLNP